MATEGINVDQSLDQKGLLCPMPIINTAKAIAAISPGQLLEVICTDPGSKADFDAWSRSTGNRLVSIQEEAGPPKLFKFHIRKS